MFLAGLVTGLFVFGAAGIANANIIWNWTFDSEFGQFVTDGDIADIALLGTYTMSDYSVTASATGGSIGSLNEGDYSTEPGNFSTDQPFSLIWDGNQVTQWLHSGSNSFDWWSFKDVAKPTQFYFFGWDTGNINDPTRAAHYDSTLGTNNPLAVGDVTVTPIPEPATVCLLGLGSLILRKRKQ